jgi:RNA recognition motif-containing protein
MSEFLFSFLLHRRFGYVSFSSDAEVQKALGADGLELSGRPLRVEEPTRKRSE